MPDYDVIVVGAGYGGATLAALLADRGARVLLLDKNDRPGGKAMTLRQDGLAYELWPIAGGPSESSRFHDLVDQLDLGVDLLTPEQAGEFRYKQPDGTWTVIPFSARPSTDPAAMARVPGELGATPDETANLLNLAAAVFTTPDDDLAAMDEVDALSWLRSFGIGRALESYQLAILNLLFVVPVDRLPASEAIRTLRDFYAGGGGRYHAGGYAEPAEALVRFLTKRGGEFRPRIRVRQIVVEDGRVAGVETAAGVFRAPVVVSNAGIQPTVLKLAGAHCFPADYVERIRRLEPSWSFVGKRFVVDAPVFTAPMVLQFSDDSWWDEERFRQAERGRWPEEPLLFVTVPSLYDPALGADDGHQIALAGTMSSADPHSPMGEMALRKVHQAVLRTWPDVARHLVRTESFTARNVSAASRDAVVPGQGGECIGIAQVIGQCGATKPDPRSPLPGLYFVGCDAGGYGCGTHQAVESGFNVAALVAGDLGIG